MSERKAINKYYPPDFDPSKLQATRKRKKNAGPTLQTVRLMTPFSMRCLSCGEYISKSKKFNARKEDTDERYLQQKIFRFHIRCPRCNGKISFRTDPKSSDFVMELGGERNYNPVKDKKQTELESYDQILERLEKEEQIEKEELLSKDKLNKITKIQELENKLLQQEEEDKVNDELTRIMRKNKTQNTDIQLQTKLDDAELDKMAQEEFSRFKSLREEEKSISPPVITIKNEVQSNRGLVSGYDSSSEEEEEEEEQKVIKTVKIGNGKKRILGK